MKRSLLAAASTKTKVVKFEREFVVFDEQALRAFFLSQGFVDEMISYRLAPEAKVPQPVEHHIVMIGDRHDHPDTPDDREAKRRGYYYVGDSASVIQTIVDEIFTEPADEINARIDAWLEDSTDSKPDEFTDGEQWRRDEVEIVSEEIPATSKKQAREPAQAKSTDDEICERIDTVMAMVTASAAQKGNSYGWLDTLESLAGQKAKYHPRRRAKYRWIVILFVAFAALFAVGAACIKVFG